MQALSSVDSEQNIKICYLCIFLFSPQYNKDVRRHGMIQKIMLKSEINQSSDKWDFTAPSVKDG